jgi:hypothetical protein
VLPLPKKLLSTEESVEPNHSQSISSRSSDNRMKLLTIPVPGAACVVTVTFPKNMYLLLLIVGASVAVLIVNSAPFDPYEIVVPASSDQSELAPFVKSVVMVVASAGSEGQEAVDGVRTVPHSQGRKEGDVQLVRGLQSVKV